MALSRPGKLLVGLVVAAVLVGGGLFAYTRITGKSFGPIKGPDDPGTTDVAANLTECPLSGLTGEVPNRPALAVKIENLPASRPQAGLESADLVYEQPVEGGITRFIVVFQCQEPAGRLGPVRSVRLVDPDIVSQFSAPSSIPLFAHSGGIPEIVQGIEAAGLLDVGFDRHPEAFERDPNRNQPHNLYTTMAELYAAADDPTGVPPGMFEYDPRVPSGSKDVSVVRVKGSSHFSEAMSWRWDAGKKAWLRFHGDSPHTMESGVQIAAKNVIFQTVQTHCSGFFDVNGTCVEEIGSIGTGDAIVFRNGKRIDASWTRNFAEDVTQYLDGRGRPIELTRGITWIILVPTDVSVTAE